MENLYWILGIFLGSCLISVYGSPSTSRREDSVSDVPIKSHETQKRWIKLGLTAQCGVCMVNCLPKIQQLTLKKKLRPRSCLDLKKNGETQNGFFTVYDNQNNSIPVYCDMTSETHSAWTLVMSWSLKNNKLMRAGLTANTPVNEKTPNWNLYRMTHAQMSSIQFHSTHWRVICSFNTHAVDYTDYVRGNFHDFNILSYVGVGQCKKIDYINIRSHAATSTTARFWQNTGVLLHVDSSATGCPFFANGVSNEDNFGYYGLANPKFRCTASADSTTQYWFGGYE